MSKKRGPNSPNESEKQKLRPSTSAAAATIGMAAVLHTISNVFSNQTQDASSIVSDTDTDSEEETPTKKESKSQTQTENPSGNVWLEQNLNQSTVKSPKKTKDPLKPLFTHFTGEGGLRDEIEIEFNSKNGKKFTGSILPTEIKHGIYIDCLKFPDHENFDGCRTSYKGKLVATIKLIEPIDIDELSSVEYFDFVRINTYRGKKTEETIGW